LSSVARAGSSNRRTAVPAVVAADRRSSARGGDPCYALRMSIPAVGDPATRVALPDATGSIHDLADNEDAGPSSTSIPRTTRPAAPSRRASSATPTTRSPSAARTSGASVPRAPRASGSSPRSSGCRSRCSPTRTTRFRDVRLVGREAELRQDVHGNGPPNVPRSTPRDASRGSGRRSSPRATRRMSSRRSTSSKPRLRDRGARVRV
jgi:hypothetical protein